MLVKPMLTYGNESRLAKRKNENMPESLREIYQGEFMVQLRKMIRSSYNHENKI
jgi:hypothetical protein